MSVAINGRYRLRNKCTAEVAPTSDHAETGLHHGRASDRTAVVWDQDGKAVQPNDWNYDLVERVREGEGY